MASSTTERDPNVEPQLAQLRALTLLLFATALSSGGYIGLTTASLSAGQLLSAAPTNVQFFAISVPSGLFLLCAPWVLMALHVALLVTAAALEAGRGDVNIGFPWYGGAIPFAPIWFAILWFWTPVVLVFVVGWHFWLKNGWVLGSQLAALATALVANIHLAERVFGARGRQAFLRSRLSCLPFAGVLLLQVPVCFDLPLPWQRLDLRNAQLSHRPPDWKRADDPRLARIIAPELPWLPPGLLRRARASGAFLAKIDLSHRKLDGADLAGANCEGANLAHASLVQANLIGASLIGAKLEHANLNGARLEESNLSHANFDCATLVQARLVRVRAPGIHATSPACSADFTRANLSEADLTGARLSKAKLIDVCLDNAIVSGVDLCHARFKVSNDSAPCGDANTRAKSPFRCCQYQLDLGAVPSPSPCESTTCQ